MAQTIEIKGGTMIKLLSVLIGLALLIFFLNQYDGDKKSALQKKNIELLENSIVVERIKNQLVGHDSLPHDVIKDIRSELSILKEETEGIYFWRPQVIVKKEDRFLKINSDSHGYYSKKVSVPVDSKTESILEELQKKGSNVFEVLDSANRNNGDKRIILPLNSNEQRQAYLYIKYHERN